MNRRTFLGALGCAAVSWVPGTSRAVGEASKIQLAQYLYPGTANSRKSGMVVLSEELRLQTSIACSLDVATIKGNSPLFETPLLFAACDRPRGDLPERMGSQLTDWIGSGGTLIVENVGLNGPSEGFDDQFRRDMKKLFPRKPLRKIPSDHVLFRSFYKMDYPAGRVISRSYFEGIEIGGRMAVIYSQNDVLGALSRDTYGRWAYDVVPGGERQREMAIRMGINFVEYALCQDYKADQVHVQYLLRKRKWKTSDLPKANSGTSRGGN